MSYTDLANDTLRQIELYGCSFIVEMGDTQTNLLMDYHSALCEAEMLSLDTGLRDSPCAGWHSTPSPRRSCRLSGPDTSNGTATAFLQTDKHTNLQPMAKPVINTYENKRQAQRYSL